MGLYSIHSKLSRKVNRSNSNNIQFANLIKSLICLLPCSIQFRYGEPYPNFYEGTLEEALNEACHKPAKEVSAEIAMPMQRIYV